MAGTMGNKMIFKFGDRLSLIGFGVIIMRKKL
jgi:hypothetical protein